jgi:ferritin
MVKIFKSGAGRLPPGEPASITAKPPVTPQPEEKPMTGETFNELLTRQVGNEFAASHQYIAVAVWLDSQDLPQLARHFYRQSLEERNHAMMIVQYILDRDLPLAIPGVGQVRNDFADVREPLALALAQEQEVTEQIKALFAAARAEVDPLGEQFMLWFLKEQVEEVASMTTLVNIAARADNLFDIENYLAREHGGGDGDHHAGHGSGTPEAAGGAV